MSAALTGVLVAVVAGVFGLGGATLAARREHERWLRGARLDAYATLITCVTNLTVYHVLHLRVRRAVPDMPAEIAGREALDRLEAFSALTRAEAVVHLLGPDEIDSLATEIVRRAQRVAMDDENSRDEQAELDRIQAKFMSTARGELSRRGTFPWNS